MRQLERTLLVIAALSIVLSLAALATPFAQKGFPSGHDVTAHITYTFLFDRALAQGQLPVRWVEWVRGGESQPLFNFYPPGLYYLIEAVHLGVPRLSTAFKSTPLLLWWCGALFTFAWLRPLGWMPAGLAAVLFAWSPYVIVDVFVRGAYPEVAAMMCAPALLWSVDRSIRLARTIDALLVAAFVGAMLTTHLISSLIFAPVVAAYAAYRLLADGARWQTAARLMAGVAIGVGISAFYLLPSIAELQHIAIGRMTSGYSDYRQHFVSPWQWFSYRWGFGASRLGLNDDMPLQIGIVQWVVIAAVVVAILRPRSGDALRLRAMTFWLLVVATAMFLMTEQSAWLWRAIPALSYLQFPWRYFMVVSLGTAALAALLVSSMSNRAIQASIVIATIGLHTQLYRDHVKPNEYIPRLSMNIDNPRWPELEPAGMRAFIERGFTPVAARQELPSAVPRWAIISGEADVRERRLADHVLDLDIVTATGIRLRINSHDFPGWIVLIDDVEAEITVDPRYGFMDVTVPAGAHRVEARFSNTPIRAVANGISVLSLALWGIGLVWSGRRRGL